MKSFNYYAAGFTACGAILGFLNSQYYVGSGLLVLHFVNMLFALNSRS